jgi:hypothetical protein
MVFFLTLLRLIVRELFGRNRTIHRAPAPDPAPIPSDPPEPPEAPSIVKPPSMDFGAATDVARAVLAKGHDVFANNAQPYDLNIVGIRDASPEFDRFGCRLVQFWKQEDGEWHVISVPFTTYPGERYTRRKLLNPRGAMILKPGQYRNIYRLRKHRGLYNALCQDGGPVNVYRDGNRDRVYDLKPNTLHSGNFGANIHAPENPDDGICRDIYDKIGAASAGCQVTKSVRDFLRLRDEWEKAKQIWGNVFTYTLIEDTDLADSSSDLVTVADVTIETPSDYAAGKAIVNLEARRDSDGTLKIYRLPENDGGGKYEIAGINDRYHPEALADLRAMNPVRREEYAARYIEEYTLKYTKLDEARLKPGTRFFVLDTTFNRGPGGSAWIVQDALRAMGHNVRRDGKWGPKTRGTLEKADRETPSLLLQKLRDSRERYERERIGYRSNLWKGLVNRWNAVHEIAEEMNSNLF